MSDKIRKQNNNKKQWEKRMTMYRGRGDALLCSPPACFFPQSSGPSFCPVQPASPPKIHVFHLETRPSSPAGPPALQLVLSKTSKFEKEVRSLKWVI